VELISTCGVGSPANRRVGFGSIVLCGFESACGYAQYSSVWWDFRAIGCTAIPIPKLAKDCDSDIPVRPDTSRQFSKDIMGRGESCPVWSYQRSPYRRRCWFYPVVWAVTDQCWYEIHSACAVAGEYL